MRTLTVSLMLVLIFLYRSTFGGEIEDAGKNGDVGKIKVFLTNNPYLVNNKNLLSTFLQTAAFCGHKDMVELLLATGADVDTKDKDGSTPLATWRQSAPAKQNRVALL